MKKSDLIDRIAGKGDFTKKDSEKFLTTFLDALTELLKEGETVNLTGFGTFDVKDIPERDGINPRTGEPMKLGAKKRVTFKAGVNLKREINE